MPSHVGTLAPLREYGWTCAFFSPPESTNQMTNRSVQPFLHSSWQKVPTLYNGQPFPPKLLLPMEGPGPPSKLWFLGPTLVHNPNGISISSAIFAQLMAECHQAPPPHHHNRFTALFKGPPGWAGTRRKLLDFMIQRKTNRDRHTDHPTGYHSIRTNQWPPPPSPLTLSSCMPSGMHLKISMSPRGNLDLI